MKKSLLLLGLLASLNANAANLINNGGFEEYTVAAGSATHIHTGVCTTASDQTCTTNQSSFDWNPSTGALSEFLEIRNNYGGVAPEGNNFAELNPKAQSGIIQTFTAQAGLGTLSWLEKGREGTYNPGNYGYQVFLNGASIFSGLTTSTANWTLQSFLNVNLLQGNNTLSFVSLNSTNDVGAQIDNISLVQTSVTTAVPEPETYGMMMLGLAMLGFASRRRKQ